MFFDSVMKRQLDYESCFNFLYLKYNYLNLLRLIDLEFQVYQQMHAQSQQYKH